MTLDQWIPTVEGKVLDFDGIPADAGQCIQLVSYYVKDVLNVPVFYANAIDWWEQFDSSPLVSNFTKHPIIEGPPKKGDIVVWGRAVGSIYGHIDICIEDGVNGIFLGFDSNWAKDMTAHKVKHTNYLQYILGYLRFKGDNMPTLTTAGNLEDLCLMATGRSSVGDPNLKNLLGQDLEETIRYFLKLPEHLALLDRAAANNYVPVSETLYRKKG